MKLKTFLILTGIATLILLSAPDLVTLGLFALILPGLIMSVIPTVFAYTALFALIRTRLPLAPGRGRNLAAAALALAIGCIVAAPWAVAERVAFHREAEVPEIIPATAVPLAGDVLLLRERIEQAKRDDGKWMPACGALCAALLDTPAVSSVTVAQHDAGSAPLRYGLRPKAQTEAKTLYPERPEEILQHLPKSPATFPRGITAEHVQNIQDERKAVAARWAVRLTGDESLVVLDAAAAPAMTISIREPRRQDGGDVAVAEVEIRQGETAVLRVRRVTGKPLMMPLMVTPVGSGDLHMKWELARNVLRTGPEYDDYKPIRTLFEHTNLAAPVLAADTVAPLADEMASRIADALADPARPAGDEAFSLVPQWLKTRRWNSLSADDIEMVKALIADRRVTELHELYDGSARDVSPLLREAISARLRLPENPYPVRSKLDELITNMPAGTYARLRPDEEAILADSELRRAAPALVLRLADGGAAAVPLLMTLLTEEARHPARHQSRLLDSLSAAFTRLGAVAAPALPLVDRLFSMRPSPITNLSNDVDKWQVAMVLMGKPLEEVSFPSNPSPERLVKDRERLAKNVERAAAEASKAAHD